MIVTKKILYEKFAAVSLLMSVFALTLALAPQTKITESALAASGTSLIAEDPPFFYNAPEQDPEAANGLLYSFVAERDGGRKLTAYYPITQNEAIDTRIQAFVQKKTQAFKDAHQYGSLDMLFSVYDYKGVVLTAVFDIYEYDVINGLKHSLVSSSFNKASGEAVKRGDLFAEGWLEAIGGGEQRDYEVFAPDGDSVRFFLSGGAVKVVSIAGFGAYFKGEAYALKYLAPEGGGQAEAEDESAMKDPLKPLPGKLIALTFDDGPHKIVTPQILDALSRYNAKATFFMVGSRIGMFPELVQRVIDEGHTIGNHSWDHKQLTKLGSAGLAREIDETNKAVAAITGITPDVLRPPYGSYNKALLKLCGERRMAVINWDIDTNDWRGKSAGDIANWVNKNAHAGGIVLMHDLYPNTAAAVPMILDELTKQGYTFVTVEDLLNNGNEMQAGRVYRFAAK